MHPRRSLILWCGLVSALLASTLSSQSAEATREQRLAQWLKLYPEADTNKDGKLTEEEARAFIKRGNPERERPRAAKAAASDTQPTEADVRYGDHPRNVVDFYRAKSDTPTPVLIYIHGGGFVGGDKGKAMNVGICRKAFEAGVSVVSANYTFVIDHPGQPGKPFPAPMLDCARMVQFVRSKAKEWNLDPERLALTGGSAGACISIWLATQDDLAKPDSDDPIARLSTKPACVVSAAGQSTLDPKVVLKNIGGSPLIHASLRPFYAVDSIEELDTPEKRKLVEWASSLNHVTDDDPPIYMAYGSDLGTAPLPASASTGESIHHAMFGKLLQDRYREVGLQTCYLSARDVKCEIDEFTFLKRYLGIKD